MSKYLLLYRSSVSAADQIANSDPEAGQAGMELWMSWAAQTGSALADMGSPLGGGATVTSEGAIGKPSQPFIGGYSILEAGSIEEATRLLTDHPHFHAPGEPSIEVLEFVAIPGM
jgi:hypothetical protein